MTIFRKMMETEVDLFLCSPAKTHIRFGYMGHFYHRKWPFYRRKLAWCTWQDFPKINLPWELSMVTSKGRKKPPMTINPFAPWKFCEKTSVEGSQVVFWSLSCYKEPILTMTPFKGHRLRGLFIQIQNISLQSLGMCRKQNFEIVFGLKSGTTVLTFTFRFLSSPLFSLFLPHFFSFAGHLEGFSFVGKVFRTAFKILRLNKRKDRWVIEQNCHRNFQVNVRWFFAFFSGVLNWILLILV